MNIVIDTDVDSFVSWERSKVALRGEKHISKALCLPFFPILNAIGNPTVDYFSLDIEGSELPILQSIPWEKVRIKVKDLSLFITINIKLKIFFYEQSNT